ncbi:CD209 antigen-like protein B [Mytilus galloprovincialis]|uniref:CD209 antigen-like protein B n=1 Tax=Mytilus galloprovincialis TaxID=29158 RepID=UPI003F7BF3A9
MLTSPAHMSDCTLMATGQTNGVNTKNTVSSTTLVTGSTMPPGIEPPVTSTIAATKPALPQTICGCPSGFTRIPADSGNCYLACDSNSDWLGAVLACRGIGAYLWEPNTDEEVGALAQAILNNSGDKFWTGATDQVNEDMTSFVLGSELTFTLTAGSDGPNSDCVAYEQTNFIYRTCFLDRKCVCERNFCVTTTT